MKYFQPMEVPRTKHTGKQHTFQHIFVVNAPFSKICSAMAEKYKKRIHETDDDRLLYVRENTEANCKITENLCDDY